MLAAGAATKTRLSAGPWSKKSNTPVSREYSAPTTSSPSGKFCNMFFVGCCISSSVASMPLGVVDVTHDFACAPFPLRVSAQRSGFGKIIEENECLV